MYKVLLPGEILIDRFTIDNKIEDKVGGAPANVAAAITKLGVEAMFVGVIGDDLEGRKIVNELKSNNLNTNGIIIKKAKTTIANVSIDSNGERSFTFNRGSDEMLNKKDVVTLLKDDYDILHLGSATAIMGGHLWETYKYMLDSFESKIVVFDPNYREALYSEMKETFIKRSTFLISRADITKVSLEELKLLTDCDDMIAAAKKLISLGTKLVLVTLGKDGTLVLTKNFYKIVPSVKVKQVDTTGAGDSFIGAIVGQIAINRLSKEDIASKQMIEFVRKANICASIVVTKIGAFETIPSWDEIQKVYNDNK